MTREFLEKTHVLKTETLSLPDRFPFPYTQEEFTPEEEAVLSKFFTNTDSPVFAIYGLPQEVVGAMFSRYSRTSKSVRRVFLDEFWASEELGIQNITENIIETKGEGIESAKEHAEKFYRRVFAEYGDDSVIQMGSVHISFEFVSQIAAKAIEDQRVASAYIEKSTRYVDFGSNVDGHFLFMEEPTVMNSEFAQEYLDWSIASFEAYKRHIPATQLMLRRKYPLEEQVVLVPSTGQEVKYDEIGNEDDKVRVQKAYERALKAKTFDTIRVFLPTTTVTNLGAHYSGQAAEHTINKMISSQHPEVRLLGVMAYHELEKVAPSFLQNVDHAHGSRTREYLRDVRNTQRTAVESWVEGITPGDTEAVRLVDWDEDADLRIATQLVYTGQKNKGLSKAAIRERLRVIKEEDLQRNPELTYSPRLAELIASAVPERSAKGLSRRHKLPRAFEHTTAEVEFDVDFGIYRDLQRNRISSTERQMLTADELFIPEEFYEEGMEEVRTDYERLAQSTKDLNRKLTTSGNPKLFDASEYVTMFGNKLRFNVRANIRQWAFFAELRTIEGGHPSYRRALQEAARQILGVYPFLEPHFAHVNWVEDYGLGRLKAEVRTQEKLSNITDGRS
ncbi:hypothetical protein A2715_02210 [Candidatus Woesebacteria bacterium RIFCSPHIGHO2_01_FULL_39_32]|uniref:Thymidylate synthase complementing protein ThyX n=2 Tax=Candidatus Woeseibacteriota TaxID=1752722 RepID=A0A0G0PQJ8_9BACT|nr:MAG: hypothetical protein UT61_C0007G0010 [Candidatus Woesebacteria bacterium GW2011_GWA1_39_8]OGM04617.1 MAG: hypothetical protein A2124_01920 [Candidatus Woesebacteria bacterium GWB1_37_5]OGM23969.1 MAG: hypothetical protein A2715_02210 [Candidatus Woesebacteria bacterium RIFCSPHIGHO2_01_FULL_39_32]OGM37475.1 MAG: hypothetical protein A3F01_03445 [Candidatus Woesebacteria bacterium RIFCSPHIGHO2_12_FULL_38_11]OGM64158.1 MAG: hypothetical protein A2893_03450 [Candidatus Woesebacteria bacteri